METFYLIVLGIATVVLILILTFVGLIMQTGKKNLVYPPSANTCPDNWTVDGSYCVIPTSLGNNTGSSLSALNASLKSYIPTGRSGVFDPNSTAWISGGKTAVCAQKEWAHSKNILWDGVSNYNSC
jgi:hypothetical protein